MTLLRRGVQLIKSDMESAASFWAVKRKVVRVSFLVCGHTLTRCDWIRQQRLQMYHSELFGIFAAYSSNHECQVYMPKGEVLHLPPLSYHYGTSVHSTKRSTIEQSSTTQPHTDFKPRFIELLQDFSTSIPILSDIMSAARTQHTVNVRFPTTCATSRYLTRSSSVGSGVTAFPAKFSQ